MGVVEVAKLGSSEMLHGRSVPLYLTPHNVAIGNIKNRKDSLSTHNVNLFTRF